MLPLALAPSVFLPQTYCPCAKAPADVKAAAGKHDLAVETWLRILQRVHLDHAAHFSAIFRGNARGIDAHRLHVVRFNLRAEAGRAIVRQRNAIDHKLRLIFRAARMQDGIAFV